eukprot:2263497-Amphidinium_carterae.1
MHRGTSLKQATQYLGWVVHKTASAGKVRTKEDQECRRALSMHRTRVRPGTRPRRVPYYISSSKAIGCCNGPMN